METPEVVAVVGGVAEIVGHLIRVLGDRNFEFATSVAPAVVSGVVVGGCTLVGGLLGGRMGLFIGGSIGSYITSNFRAQIQTLSEMLQQLAVEQLRALFHLLRRTIVTTVTNALQIRVNRLTTLENLLELYGTNPQVESHIIETITNYFRGIHGNNLRLLPA